MLSTKIFQFNNVNGKVQADSVEICADNGIIINFSSELIGTSFKAKKISHKCNKGLVHSNAV